MKTVHKFIGEGHRPVKNEKYPNSFSCCPTFKLFHNNVRYVVHTTGSESFEEIYQFLINFCEELSIPHPENELGRQLGFYRLDRISLN